MIPDSTCRTVYDYDRYQKNKKLLTYTVWNMEMMALWQTASCSSAANGICLERSRWDTVIAWQTKGDPIITILAFSVGDLLRLIIPANLSSARLDRGEGAMGFHFLPSTQLTSPQLNSTQLNSTAFTLRPWSTTYEHLYTQQ